MAEVTGPGGQIQPKKVSGSKTSQTSGGVREGVGTGRPAGSSKVASPTGPQVIKPAGEAKPETSIIRQLTSKDIGQHLLSLELSNSDFNLRFASLMLRYGLELSKENLNNGLRLLQGTQKGINSQEAVLVLLSKGIDSPQAVKVLETYFAQNPQLADQFVAIKGALANLQNALGANQALLNTNLVTQLVALITQFENTLNTTSKNFLRSPALSRSQILGEMRALKSLLLGIDEKMIESSRTLSAGKEMLSSSIMSASSKLDNIMENLIAQSILSQLPQKGDPASSNYNYYQIPNIFSEPPNTVEILVKKDGGGQSSEIDLNNTQIVMSLDAPHMGKLSISLNVKDQKLSFVFNTQNEETRSLIVRESSALRQKMSDLNYQTSGFQVRVNPALSAIKPYLIPLLGLDHLLKVDTKI